MLPHNVDIEKSVLGCLLLGKESYVTQLGEIDFFIQTHQWIYRAVDYLYQKNRAVDCITVSDLLKKKLDNALEVVAGLQNYPASPENISYYINSLKTYTTRREVLKACSQAVEMASNGQYENCMDLKCDVLQKFDFEVYGDKKADHSMPVILERVMVDIEKSYNLQDEEKLFTGFYDLDKIMAGLHPEELTIIAARPGIGKSAFAIQLMIQLAKKGNHCLLVSREMSVIQVGKRILANLSKIDGHKLRMCKSLQKEDWEKISRANNEICRLPIEINDKISTIQEIRSYCRELYGKKKLDVLIVDYIGLLQTLKRRESRRLEVEDISRQLKELSLEFKIPVIALSQLNREGVRQNKEPALHDLRESGSIEQDADNVVFLHIPDEEGITGNCVDIKLIIAKQRNGATGYIYLSYVKSTFSFYNKSWIRQG